MSLTPSGVVSDEINIFGTPVGVNHILLSCCTKKLVIVFLVSLDAVLLIKILFQNPPVEI